MNVEEINEIIKKMHQCSVAVHLTQLTNEGEEESKELYYIVDNPILELVEETEEEDWDEGQNYLTVNAFIPGSLLYDGLLDCNTDEYGLAFNILSLELSVKDDEIEELKANRNDLKYCCWIEGREILNMQTIHLLPEEMKRHRW